MALFCIDVLLCGREFICWVRVVYGFGVIVGCGLIIVVHAEN